MAMILVQELYVNCLMRLCCAYFKLLFRSVGYTSSKQIERIHLKYCKKSLGVKTVTSNVGVYGELARYMYPLFINRYVQIIKCWFKLH